MFKLLRKYIATENLFSEKDRILLAVSGGVDSVVMTWLFQKLGFNYGIAHCNFSLRGEESDADENFVRALGAELGVPVYVERFETLKYAHQRKLSLQMAARELRYDWFETLRRDEGYDYVAVATHKDDELETILMNLSKGAVLEGFHGIVEKNGNIIRPMMCFTREDIEKYRDTYEIPHRNDSSNASTKYLRNKIRHEVIPVLKELNPDLLTTLARNIKRTRLSEQVYHDAIRAKTEGLATLSDGKWQIKISDLDQLKPLEPYLYHLLRRFGFRNVVVENLAAHLHGHVGRLYTASGFTLLVDRTHLLIYPKSQAPSETELFIYEDDVIIEKPVKLKASHFQYQESSIQWHKDIAYLDRSKLVFPLRIRPWKAGDRFRPLGMKNFKKVSDFLIDERVPHLEKSLVHVVETNGQIAWLIGFRIDDRFKLEPSTGLVYKLEPTD